MRPEEIRSCRQRLGLTQAQLAERFDVSANTVARWERGESVPEAPAMLRLALQALEMEGRVNSSREILRLRRNVAKNLRAAAKS